jgi:hypothetical protein
VRGSSGRRRRQYIAVEAEEVIRVVAILQLDQTLSVLRRVGRPHPICARSVEIEEVAVGHAGLIRAHFLGHVSQVRLDPACATSGVGVALTPSIGNLESRRPMGLRSAGGRSRALPSWRSSSRNSAAQRTQPTPQERTPHPPDGLIFLGSFGENHPAQYQPHPVIPPVLQALACGAVTCAVATLHPHSRESG